MAVVAAFLSNTLFNFVIGLLLARFLGPEDYGRFALAVAVAVVIQTIVFDWARLAAARFTSERVRGADPAVRATLDASLAVLVLVVALAAAAVLLSGIDLPMSRSLAALAAATAIANGLFDYAAALIRARFLDRAYARLIVGKNLLSAVLTVGGAYWFGSAFVALLGVTLSMVGALGGIAGSLRDPDAALRRAEAGRAGEMMRYGLPIVLANLFYQTVPLADRLAIAQLHGFAESGRFSFAYDIGLRIVAAIGSMLDVLLFQMAVRADETGAGRGRAQAGRNLGMVLAVLAPACAGCGLVLPSFEILVVPPEFRGAFAAYLLLLLPGLFCYGLVFFALHPVFQIDKTTWPLVAVAAGAAALNLVIVLALPASAGTASFAIAQGIAFTTAAFALVVVLARTRPVWPRLRDVAVTVLATTAMGAAVALAGQGAPGAATFALQLGLGIGVYATVAWALDLCELRGQVRALRAAVEGRSGR